MIQRVQTLFLLIAGLLLGSLLFYPLVEFLGEGDRIFELGAYKILELGNNEFSTSLQVLPIALMLDIIILITLLSIFLYKKRVLQARLSMINMILAIVWPGLVYFYSSLAEDVLSASPSYEPLLVLSWVAALFFFMARRRILIDEALVKSYDRLR